MILGTPSTDTFAKSKRACGWSGAVDRPEELRVAPRDEQELGFDTGSEVEIKEAQDESNSPRSLGH